MLDQFVWIASPTEIGRDLFLSPRSLCGDHINIQPWSTAPCVLTDCRQISLEWLTLCFSRYCSASVRDTDLSALIYQAPSCHHSQSTHSRDTVVTELGEEWGGKGGAHWDENNERSFFHKMHIGWAWDFNLYMSVQCHFLLPASARKEFLISLWFFLHEWLMCSTKGHVIINHAHTFTPRSSLSFSLCFYSSVSHTHMHLSSLSQFENDNSKKYLH